jgi:allophanate hydrolase subunit 2
MAFQLNEPFVNQLKPIITSLVMQGTVQLTPSGKLIILMRDNQTCGGYPRVLQLNESAINKLSQKYMNNEIKFELIEN